MKAVRNILTMLLLCSTTAIAAPASESSIKELLAVAQARQLVDGIRAQFDSMMQASIQQSLQGKNPTPKQQKAISNMKNRMVEIMQGELAWDKLEPMYLRLYKDAFTEEEVVGMLAFYKTPAGQAVIHKMPLLMQQTMLEMQKMTAGMMPKMQSVQEQFIAEMSAASK